MRKCDLAAEFLKKLNELLEELNKRKIQKETHFDKIKQKIEDLKNKLKDSENKVKEMIEDKKKDGSTLENKIKYSKRRDGTIREISSPGINKIKVKPINLTYQPCTHKMNICPEFTYHKTITVDSKEDFKKLDGSEYLLVDAFSHTHRSYSGFVCFLSILDSFGTLFIIDALRFRNEIVDVGLFSCKYKKIFVSPRAFYRCLKDFKIINCYTIFDLYKPVGDSDNRDLRTPLIDWRIRPIDNYLEFLLQINLIKTLEILMNVSEEIKEDPFDKNFYKVAFKMKINKKSREHLTNMLKKITDGREKVAHRIQEGMERRVVRIEKGVLKVIKDYEMPIDTEEDFSLMNSSIKESLRLVSRMYQLESSNYLEQLIKHREHLAMDYDKSIFYILSNDDLIKIYNNRPLNFKALSNLGIVISSLIKENFEGFLFKSEREDLKRKSKTHKNTQRKIPKNRDIRGNLFENRNTFFKRNVPERFKYSEDSSDIELKENEKKKNKKKVTKKKEVVKGKTADDATGDKAERELIGSFKKKVNIRSKKMKKVQK